MLQAEEPVCVQTFISESPVEALDIGVFHGLSGTDKTQFHLFAICPLVQDTPGKLRSVVDGDDLR
jgi:hypothetical protein